MRLGRKLMGSDVQVADEILRPILQGDEEVLLLVRGGHSNRAIDALAVTTNRIFALSLKQPKTEPLSWFLAEFEAVAEIRTLSNKLRKWDGATVDVGMLFHRREDEDPFLEVVESAISSQPNFVHKYQEIADRTVLAVGHKYPDESGRVVARRLNAYLDEGEIIDYVGVLVTPQGIAGDSMALTDRRLLVFTLQAFGEPPSASYNYASFPAFSCANGEIALMNPIGNETGIGRLRHIKQDVEVVQESLRRCYAMRPEPLGSVTQIERCTDLEGANDGQVNKDLFDVWLENAGKRPLQVVNFLKKLNDLGVREALDLTDSTPCVVLRKVDQPRAAAVKADFEGLGAVASLVLAKEEVVPSAKEGTEISFGNRTEPAAPATPHEAALAARHAFDEICQRYEPRIGWKIKREELFDLSPYLLELLGDDECILSFLHMTSTKPLADTLIFTSHRMLRARRKNAPSVVEEGMRWNALGAVRIEGNKVLLAPENALPVRYAVLGYPEADKQICKTVLRLAGQCGPIGVIDITAIDLEAKASVSSQRSLKSVDTYDPKNWFDFTQKKLNELEWPIADDEQALRLWIDATTTLLTTHQLVYWRSREPNKKKFVASWSREFYSFPATMSSPGTGRKWLLVSENLNPQALEIITIAQSTPPGENVFSMPKTETLVVESLGMAEGAMFGLLMDNSILYMNDDALFVWSPVKAPELVERIAHGEIRALLLDVDTLLAIDSNGSQIALGTLGKIAEHAYESALTSLSRLRPEICDVESAGGWTSLIAAFSAQRWGAGSAKVYRLLIAAFPSSPFPFGNEAIPIIGSPFVQSHGWEAVILATNQRLAVAAIRKWNLVGSPSVLNRDQVREIQVEIEVLQNVAASGRLREYHKLKVEILTNLGQKHSLTLDLGESLEERNQRIQMPFATLQALIDYGWPVNFVGESTRTFYYQSNTPTLGFGFGIMSFD